MIKKRICFVVQRYGKSILGGAEMLCASYAKKLLEFYEVDVLTTCAKDYNTWKNYFAEGISFEEGVKIIRFKTVHPRNDAALAPLTMDVYENSYNDMETGAKWLKEVGPYSIDLIKHIKAHKNEYSAFLFMGYHYYTATCGMPLVAHKSIFIPTAHDEAPLRKCNYFKYLFNIPKAILYLTNEEKNFVHGFFANKRIMYEVAGSGIDSPKEVLLKEDAYFKFGIKSKYIAYSGRIDDSKNISELLDFFYAYKEENKSDLKLVLMGEAFMGIPTREDVSCVGFVSEEEKVCIVKNALVFVMPSLNESLSISTLEAMSLKVPVLVKDYSTVLKEHVFKSKAGMLYNTKEEFSTALKSMLTDPPLAKSMGENGARYVEENYNWKEIMTKIISLIEKV